MDTFARTPVPEAVAHLLMITTAIVYGIMIVAIIRGRKENNLFRSSYYSVFMVHAVVDFALLFYVVLLLTPRKYNYFNYYTDDMKITAEVTFFIVVWLRCAVPLTHVAIAFNRFTVYMFPLKYERMWASGMVPFLTVVIWGVSFLIVLPFWLTSREEIHFLIKDDGAHMIGPQFTSYMFFTTSITTAFVVISCAYFYGYALFKSWSLNSKTQKVERRLLVCALSSSLPFVFELIRVGLMYYGMKVGPMQLAIVTSAAWIYEEAITFFLQVGVQLLLNKPLRRKTLGLCLQTTVPRNDVISLPTVTRANPAKQNTI